MPTSKNVGPVALWPHDSEASAREEKVSLPIVALLAGQLLPRVTHLRPPRCPPGRATIGQGSHVPKVRFRLGRGGPLRG
jgi:hypothetical protein